MGPWLERLTKAVQALPVIGQQMTGSGSCYFGMFPNAPVARRGARQLKALLPDCRVILSELLPG
jgi:4-diphosphocytidyl-2C-methyl-D-erythritol kinase